LNRSFQAREVDSSRSSRPEKRNWARTLQQVSDRFMALRGRRTYRWLERLTDHFNRHDFWNEIAPPFQQLKDDSLIFSGSLRGFRLQPGPNLQSVPFVAYPLVLRRPHLIGLLLAPVLEVRLTMAG